MKTAATHIEMKISRYKQNGFVLLEVLISMVILALGLLGLAGLQLGVQNTETDSYQRAQAILLTEDMADMLSSNRVNAASYVTGTATPVGTGDSQPANCTGLTGVQNDLCTWSNMLKGTSETISSSGVNVGAMTDARGCIEYVSGNPDVYRVTVAWQGMTQLSPPALLCGQNLYGNDNARRAIASLVTIANLTAP